MSSLRGQLLVAGPTLLDPNFHRTVVLVCEHTDDGALGLVLNRPTELVAAQAVPELAEVLDDEEPLMSGGPVAPSSVVLLAEFAGEQRDALMVTGDVGLVLQQSDLAGLGELTRRVRAFLGYAGWGPGQLDAELERDDWIVVAAKPDDGFAEDSGALWRRALERKGGRYALLATMPPDPSLN